MLASAIAICAQASSCPASRIASTSRARSRKHDHSGRFGCCRRHTSRADRPEFFETVVVSESRRALAAVGGDASRVVPWLDTGRFPHDGDPMSAGDLSKLITAAHKAGLRRMNCECRLSWLFRSRLLPARQGFFLFFLTRLSIATDHHHGNLSHSEWTVISALCGEMWTPHKTDPDAYAPPDKMVI